MRNIPDKITIKDSSIKRRGEKKEKNIRIKTDTGYVWDRNKLRKLAQIVKRNEDEAKEITVKVSNIGLLRQYLNELPEGEMVTDEDIIKFLK